MRCFVVLLVVAAAGLSPAAAHGIERVRKDVKDLTPSERRAFTDAILALKVADSPDPQAPADYSWYDQLVDWHADLVDCEQTDVLLQKRMRGHAGPMFLPWHRQYLMMFENALRQVSGKRITVPYWDWTDAESTAAVFTDDFMGGNGDPNDGWIVKTGKFAAPGWKLVVKNHGTLLGMSATDFLTRNMGSGGRKLPTEAEVMQAITQAAHYDVAPYDDGADPARSFRNALEGFRKGVDGGTPHGTTGCNVTDGTSGTIGIAPSVLHGAVHNYVGGVIDQSRNAVGTMAAIQASPNDPVFFLHHANIDRIWARWQRLHPGVTYEPDDPGDVSLVQREWYEHNSADAPLEPVAFFRATPRDVERIDALGYAYAEGPGASVQPAPGNETSRSTALVCRTPGQRTAA